MRPSLDPRGILLAHTLPALLLFLLLGQLFGYIRPALDPAALELWRTYAIWLGAATLTATGYAIWCIANKRTVHVLYGILVFVVHVPLLWWSMDRVNDLFPREIPFWMVPEEARLYGIRILSAALLHALIVMVGASLPSGYRGKPVRDLLIGAAIPLCCYLFVQVVEPYRMGIDFERHAWVVVMVVLVVAFLFFMFRGLLAMVRRRSSSGAWAIASRIIVGLILPLLGLAVHNDVLGNQGRGMFGDLSHWGFYLIALLNGLVVVWEPSTVPRTRLVQFLLRSIGFSYVLYFFILFLPFLPLSIVAIVAVGVGFLLLAPVLLFLVQGMQLWNDLRFLRDHHGSPTIIAGMLLGLSVLPAIITGYYLNQRSTLHRALQVVYHPMPGDDPAAVNAKALGGVLEHVAANKERSGWATEHTPFLTPWYNRVVLDNLTLSDTKLDHLQKIFIGGDEEHDPRDTERPRTTSSVVLDSVSTRTSFDEAQQVWRTWVDLQMTNHHEWQGEYSTVFELPPGAYLSNEYLMIAGEEVRGILAERKAATWIYQQIRDFRRDPSLTTYGAPDAISLKVFPFAQGETRHAGFEVLHKEPLPLQVDSFQIMLGNAGGPAPSGTIITPDGALLYVPTDVKARLPKVERPAHVHLILDGSIANAEDRSRILQRIERMMATEGIPSSRITAHITDVRTRSLPWGEEAKAAYEQHIPKGGFFSDRPIRAVLTEACLNPSASRQVIVIATQTTGAIADPGVLLDGLLELSMCQPDAQHFLMLQALDSFSERSYRDPYSVVRNGVDINDTQPVHAWPDTRSPQAWFAVDSLPGTAVLKGNDQVQQTPLNLRDWNDALALEARWRTYELFPGQGTAGWLSVVRGSFQAQVLTPQTAWICLESDLQRNALLKKQEETLSANAALDAGEEELVRMSEPGIWWLMIVPLLLWVLRWRRGM